MNKTSVWPIAHGGAFYGAGSSTCTDDDYSSESDSCDDYSDDENVDAVQLSLPSRGSCPSLPSDKNNKIGGQSSVSSTLVINRCISLPLMKKRRIISCAHQTISAQNRISTIPQQQHQVDEKPHDHLSALLLENEGIRVKPCVYSDLTDFFVEIKEENIDAYVVEVVTAFRNQDLDAIKSFHREGKFLQCCNKFGESVVHLTCRRGSHEILDFITSEAKVSIRVRCDSGRTPLHDACWTDRPNFKLIALVLKICPDLLFIKDNKGFTPLCYVPRRRWGIWCKWLDENKDILVPKEIPFDTKLRSGVVEESPRLLLPKEIPFDTKLRSGVVVEESQRHSMKRKRCGASSEG